MPHPDDIHPPEETHTYGITHLAQKPNRKRVLELVELFLRIQPRKPGTEMPPPQAPAPSHRRRFQEDETVPRPRTERGPEDRIRYPRE